MMEHRLHLSRSILRYVRGINWRTAVVYRPDPDAFRLPFRIMRHPFQVFERIREGHGSVLVANLLLLAILAVDSLRFAATGFLFNYNRLRDFDFWLQFVRSNAILILWCIGNWATCTLLDGEARFREIWITSIYSMIPRILAVPLLILFSWLFSIEEGVFLQLVESVALIWSGLLLLAGMKTIHQFEVGKTVASSILTVLAVSAMILVGILLFSIFQQLISFIEIVVREGLSRL